jgi:hypothetical protein
MHINTIKNGMLQTLVSLAAEENAVKIWEIFQKISQL